MATRDTMETPMEPPTAGGALDPERLATALAATPGADAWQLEVLRDEEAQLYLIGDRVEARRTVTSERARVVVHNRHAPREGSDVGADRALGLAALTLLPGDAEDDGALAARLRDAVAMASLTDNRPYALPPMPAGGVPAVRKGDPALAGDLEAALEGLRARFAAAAVAAASPSGDVRVSSAEFFATRGHRALRTSAGVRHAGASTRVALEYVLMARDGGRADGREAEFLGEPRRRRVEDLALERTVAAHAAFARHTLRAATPATHRGPVILSGRALADLFNPPFFQVSPLVVHTSARAAYQRLSRLTPGEPITPEPPRGDPLTLWSDATRPFGLRSAAADEDGLPGANVLLIEDGVFRRHWADARHAAYLGVPATGDFGNVTLARGATPLSSLREASGGPVYEIVSLSFLNPDATSGDFVSEIKLGYRHDAGGTAPIKGGSLSGNLFAALVDARLSAEGFSDGLYYGPAAIRFGNLTISGG